MEHAQAHLLINLHKKIKQYILMNLIQNGVKI